MDLTLLRQKIDMIDQAMIELLSERFKLTDQVGMLKATERMPAQDAGRERLMMTKISELAEEHGLSPYVATSIYRYIIDLVISRHDELRKKLDN